MDFLYAHSKVPSNSPACLGRTVLYPLRKLWTHDIVLISSWACYFSTGLDALELGKQIVKFCNAMFDKINLWRKMLQFSTVREDYAQVI